MANTDPRRLLFTRGLRSGREERPQLPVEPSTSLSPTLTYGLTQVPVYTPYSSIHQNNFGTPGSSYANLGSLLTGAQTAPTPAGATSSFAPLVSPQSTSGSPLSTGKGSQRPNVAQDSAGLSQGKGAR